MKAAWVFALGLLLCVVATNLFVRPPATGGVMQLPRPAVRVGETGPGALLIGYRATWTPQHANQTFGVSRTLPLFEPRLRRFADFPVLIPTTLPQGCRLGEAGIYWDPQTDHRMVQIPLQGAHSGMITERRLKRLDPMFPAGAWLTTEQPSPNAVYRRLQANAGGVAVTILSEMSLTDEELISMWRSLKPLR